MLAFACHSGVLLERNSATVHMMLSVDVVIHSSNVYVPTPHPSPSALLDAAISVELLWSQLNYVSQSSNCVFITQFTQC